jgi:hypothetical protein
VLYDICRYTGPTTWKAMRDWVSQMMVMMDALTGGEHGMTVRVEGWDDSVMNNLCALEFWVADSNADLNAAAR